MPRLLAFLHVLLLVTAGCGPAPERGAARGAVREGPVSVLDSGHWERIVACSGRCVVEYSFWVDLAVRNDAYDKSVGILWTADHWTTVNRAAADYKDSLGDGYERWGLDVTVGQMFDRPEEIEYAAFAGMNGTTSWDPKNNFYIYNKVSPEAPVRRLRSEVHIEGTEVVMTGMVRVFDLAYEKQVTVRYSTDGWATFADVDAQWVEAEDFAFRVAGIPTAPLPAEVQYAVRYRANSQEFWDSNSGQNFRHRLDPELDLNATYLPYDLTRPIAGNLRFSPSVRTDLAVEGLDARIDDGVFADARPFVFTTYGLADGAHRIELRLRLRGGVAVTREFPFQVQNRIEPLDVWRPTVEQGGQPQPFAAAWDLARDGAGRLYVITDNNDGFRIMRYEAYATTTAPLVYDDLPEAAWSLTVDALGRVYAVVPYDAEKALYRLTADGHLDPGFGEGGRLPLTGDYAGQPFCYVGDAAVSDHHLYLLDTCNERVVRLTPDGAPAGVVSLSSFPGGLYHDGAALWVMTTDALVRLSDGPSAPLALDLTIPFAGGFTVNNPAGLTRTANGLFWTGTFDSLLAFGEDGVIQAEWWGGGANDLPGGFSSPHSVVTLPDGSVGVLGAIDAQVARFAAALR